MRLSVSILLVEDDDFDAREFQRALQKSQVTVDEMRVCKYAETALETLSSWMPDCIFVDYQLPGTNGLQLLRKIKEQVPHLPVIVLTSQGDERIAVEMMKAGAMDYFPKSEINPEKITKTIHTMLQMLGVEKKRREAQAELAETEAFIEKLALLSPNILYVIDIEKWVNVYRNSQLCNIIGFSETELSALSESILLDIIDQNDVPAFRQHYHRLRRTVRDGEVIEREFRLRHRNGSEIWIISREVPFKRNERGVVTQVLGTAIDITRRKHMEQELVTARQLAEEAAKTKSDFLSTMSHEIRTPMNAIIGFTDLLLNSHPAGETLEHLQTVKYSADNLMNVLDDILDFAKIEAGKLSLENLAFDLKEKLAYVIKTFQVMADKKQVALRFLLDDQVPAQLQGDPYRLNQILVNLIGNALKFTHTGFVQFSVTRVDETDTEVGLRMEVSDSGIGIQPEKLDRIFDSFSQVHHNTAARSFGGTGLGLAITRRLVQLMDGTITASSHPGKGSTFTVFIKFKKGKQEVSERKAFTDPGNFLNGYQVLVAEDVLPNQVLLRHLLTKWGAGFEICNNGQEALDSLYSKNFDLILMDLQMPVMDGITAMQTLRAQHPEMSHIPVIALTADTFAETLSGITDCHFDDFVTKPFRTEELIQKISQHLSISTT